MVTITPKVTWDGRYYRWSRQSRHAGVPVWFALRINPDSPHPGSEYRVQVFTYGQWTEAAVLDPLTVDGLPHWKGKGEVPREVREAIRQLERALLEQVDVLIDTGALG